MTLRPFLPRPPRSPRLTLVAGLAALGVGGAAGCNGDQELVCGPVSECGGDIVGSWHVREVCAESMPVPPEATWEACPGYSATSELAMRDDVFIAFNGDGSFASGLSFRTIVHESIPLDCLPVTDCAAYADALGGECTDVGASCDCTFDFGISGAQRWGSYRAEGGLTLTMPGAGEVPVARCVDGDTMALSYVEGGRAVHALLERGPTDSLVSNAHVTVLDLTDTTLEDVTVGDGPPDTIHDGRAGLTRLVSSGPTEVAWTIAGVRHTTSVEARVGFPLTVAVVGEGGESLVVPRPTDGYLRLTIVNVLDREIDVRFRDQALRVAPGASATTPDGGWLSTEGDVEVLAGGVSLTRLALVSKDDSQTLFVAPDGTDGVRVIADDARTYNWLGVAPETARVRFVHAAPKVGRVWVRATATPLSRLFDIRIDKTIEDWGYPEFATATDYVDMVAGYQRVSVSTDASETLRPLVRADLPTYPAGGAYLVALVDGPDGAALRLVPDDPSPDHRSSVTLVDAGAGQTIRAVTLDGAALAPVAAAGSFTRFGVDTLDALELRFGDAAGARARYTIPAGVADGPLAIFVLADRSLLVVDAASGVAEVMPEPAP